MMLRRKVLVLIVTLLITASLLTVFTGCEGVTQTIIGSGNLITQQIDSTDFTKLEISHVFQAKVTRSDSLNQEIPCVYTLKRVMPTSARQK